MVALSPVSPSLAPATNYDRINAAITEAAKVSNKQDAFDLAGLLSSVSQKALQTDLAALTTVVNGKASAASVTALQTTVAGKASQDALETLTTAVAGKASAADLSALTTTVGTKASASSVVALTATVGTKASQSSVDALTSSVAAQAQALAGKAAQSDLMSLTQLVNLKASQSALDSLGVTVTGKVGVAAFNALSAVVDTKASLGALNDLREALARINAGLYPSERPGDTPSAFSASRAGGDPGALAPLDVSLYPIRSVADGLGVEVSGSREVWERTLHAVEPGRLWRARWRYVRTVNAQDPENDSVQALIQWYDRNRAVLGSAAQVEAFTPSVAGGAHERLDFVGLAGVTGVTITRPSGAVYFRLGLKAFGNEARTVLTDLQAADVSDIDDAIVRLVPSDALPNLSARIDALVSDLAEEADLRADGDAALNDLITAEATRATAAEKAIDKKVGDEIARATQAEEALGGRITDETTRATAAETALGGRIDGLNVVEPGAGRIYGFQVTDTSGNMVAGLYAQDEVEAPGSYLVRVGTDVSGYGRDVDYPAYERDAPGRTYSPIETDGSGYAGREPLLAAAGDVLLGRAYGDTNTDLSGYARDADSPLDTTLTTSPGGLYAEIRTDQSGYMIEARLAKEVSPYGGRAQEYRRYPSFDYNVIHFICYGQSLSRGLTANPVITTSVSNAFMYFGGVRTNDNPALTSAQAHDSLKLFAEAYSGPDRDEGETPVGGTLACLRQLMVAGGYDPSALDVSFLGSAPGQGGLQISDLGKGTPPFQRLTDDIAYGPTVCAKYGLTYGMPAFSLIQAESDYFVGTPGPTWSRAVVTLRADVESEVVRATGSSDRVICLLYQIGTHDYYGVPPYLALEQTALARNGSGDFFTVCPMYIMEYQTDVHIKATGSVRLGAYQAKALYALYLHGRGLGPKPKALHLISARRQGRIVVARYDVPVPPLALDTSRITDPNGAKGFEIFNPATGLNIPISGVTTVGPDCVRITCSAQIPAGSRLRYAYTPPAGFVPAGRSNTPASGSTPYGLNVGARGCLRDSDPTVFDPTGLNLKLHNYAFIEDMEII